MSRASGGCSNKTNISEKIADTGIKLLCAKSKADQHIKYLVYSGGCSHALVIHIQVWNGKGDYLSH